MQNSFKNEINIFMIVQNTFLSYYCKAQIQYREELGLTIGKSKMERLLNYFEAFGVSKLEVGVLKI